MKVEKYTPEKFWNLGVINFDPDVLDILREQTKENNLTDKDRPILLHYNFKEVVEKLDKYIVFFEGMNELKENHLDRKHGKRSEFKLDFDDFLEFEATFTQLIKAIKKCEKDMPGFFQACVLYNSIEGLKDEE